MISKLTLFLLSLFVFSAINVSAQDGKTLFMSKCASCHNPFKDGTGPALAGLEDRHKWADHKELLAWISNPGGYMAKDPYTQGLKAKFGSLMTPFPDLKLEEVTAIVNYINGEVAKKTSGGDTTGTTTAATETSGNQNAIIFGVISLILAIIALILMQVNSNLKKMSDDAEGIQRPEPVPFYKNKIYIAMAAVLFFIVGGYFVTKGAIGLQRQTNYQPVQPVYYSHKVHAGINQINCLYCHGNAFEGKSAAIPSVNVCMNCHKNITSYEKGPKLYDKDGQEINGTAEIAKLHKYAGFDPKNPNAWDPSKAKPIEWVRIHNLPDHVYFNHSQHTKAGNVQCQTCHGNIPEMDEVKQFSELSMGWCINCHRNTKVDFNYDSTKGNKFYSIYEKFHNDIKAGKMDSVTVKDIGGLECQKCHY
ncbi:c-type cytochrome [Terrimonas pollutisoli]|uniref:c-type cytochrome n=1 Tax=Terrimonas pollutisoli TaxID=3034147 RepID=UPI0023ECBA6C|nr:c-type cytochrome [Terrimonas sp. H1YJ31]